ncbi:hypothetical protein F5878DRAFT_712473 [Lentinula raphanica]|uniref:Uncharacterized protein n=1 Tax=Lentinula raphanica TaxID=153919 RepID=A0AA38UAA4_9AGAR|nr:hypothetical protein F5880DRAFT_1600263 [Lentinula raphanica]KAJ3834795.1 hypothetical protein F5878DRAFT_712473 [Lentinula raphanica]
MSSYIPTLSNAPVSAEISDQFEVVKSAMIDLMAEPRFKENTILCFGLAYHYPVTRVRTAHVNDRSNRDRSDDSSNGQDDRNNHAKSAYYTTKELSQYLKGSDALLYRACEAAGLVPSLKVLYDLSHYDYLTRKSDSVTWTGDNFLRPDELHEDEDDGLGSLFQGQGMTRAKNLIVVTKRLHRTGLDTNYLTEYGNGAAEMDTVYGEVCIIATKANATNQPES